MENGQKKQPAMNEQMIKFCEYYVETRNGVRSYAMAYNKPIDKPKDKEKNYSVCNSSASKLLKDARIKKYINDRLAEIDYERELSEQEIIIQLNKLALGAGYKENIKLEALKTLAKMKGMFEDEETNKEATVNIQIGNDIKDLLKKAK